MQGFLKQLPRIPEIPVVQVDLGEMHIWIGELRLRLEAECL